MLDAIKHITDDNFFFQEDSAQVHCVSNTIQLSEICDFRVSAFCQLVQRWDVFWHTVYSAQAQEMAKHRAKFGWPPLNDVSTVTMPRRETHWHLLGCRKLPNRFQLLVGRRWPYC